MTVFLKDHTYIICFDILRKALTFTCTIQDDDENFVTFKDKFGKLLTYNKSNIISVEAVEDGN